jgi:hypothetical protein
VPPDDLFRRITQALLRRPVPADNRQSPIDRKRWLGCAIDEGKGRVEGEFV